MCLLRLAKKKYAPINFCTSKKSRKNYAHYFKKNGYPKSFVRNVTEKFNDGKPQNEKYEKDFVFTIGVSYYLRLSNQFAKRFATLIKLKFNVDIIVYYTTVKTASYFPLKCATPFALLSNVVYKFICSCDTGITYIGMTTRHMDTGAKEHLCIQKIQNQQFTIIIIKVVKHVCKQNMT